MARSKNGEAIRARRRSPAAIRKLVGLSKRSQGGGDLGTWRRAYAVLGYVEGKSVVTLCGELDVSPASVKRWLKWYDAAGLEGLKPRKAPGAAPRLSDEERAELTTVVENGPLAAGFTSGVWTGPMIGAWIFEHFGVRYHNHHIPRLLHSMGFSVQRPRKRLARADAKAQAAWMRKRLPAIKRSPSLPRGRDVRGRGELLA